MSLNQAYLFKVKVCEGVCTFGILWVVRGVRARGEVLIAIGDQRREGVNCVGRLHHRNLIRLHNTHAGGDTLEFSTVQNVTSLKQPSHRIVTSHFSCKGELIQNN